MRKDEDILATSYFSYFVLVISRLYGVSTLSAVIKIGTLEIV